MRKPKVLFLDIETLPLELVGFGLYDQNFGLNQVRKDWTVASWAAKWAHKDKMYYADVSKQKNKRDDARILGELWPLLDSADIICTQNGKRFDIPKLKARFVINGFKPPSPSEHIDTRQIAKRVFGFTSNSLEYMCKALNLKFQKLPHKKFPGMELWTACLDGNKKAWAEMKLYNCYDVLCLEALYERIQAWDRSVSLTKYDPNIACNCGSTELIKNGYAWTATGRFQRYSCKDCGAWVRGKENLLSKERKAKLKVGLRG
jgi:uncharacterized protein YprB with RNaseH-like and TPR domain